MWVIFKEVGGFYYYLKEIPIHKIEWVGLIDNATRFPTSDKASEIAVKHKLHHSQIMKL